MSDEPVDLEAFRSKAKGRKPRKANGSGRPPSPPSGDGGDGERRPSQRDKILLVCAGLELWHDEDGAGYCTVEVAGHLKHLALRGRGFRAWLTKRFGDTFKSEIAGREVAQGFTEQAFQDARRGLEAEAMYGPEHPPFQRVGGDAERVVLDLGRDDWRMVEITAEGWAIVDRCATKMVRSPGMRPLPLPVRGGSLGELQDLLNFGAGAEGERAFRLYAGCLVAALAPSLNRLILAVSGEQGSGKSTLTTTFKSLIDPHRAMRRSLPANSEDLFIAAASTHCLLFDNVSELHGWLADDLARIATGGSLGKRTKFSDTEETYLTVRCPIVLNGIPDLATRADLADRAVVLKLPALQDADRRDEADLDADLADAAPRVLGALLDGVAAALRNRDDIADLIRWQPRRPRMVDATIWVEAAAEAFGWPRWSFLNAYLSNRTEATEIALEADVVAEAVREMMRARGDGGFKGQAKALLEVLTSFASERTLKSRDWPKTAHHLTNRLRRSQPGLRRIGIKVDFTRTSSTRVVAITAIEQEEGDVA